MKQSAWSSKVAFILAASGSAIGLGNIWRFPFISAEQGGGNFILLYAIFLIALGIPLFIVEIVLGRLAPNHILLNSFSRLKGKMPAIGYIFIFIPLLLLSYYIVIGGWSAYYLGISLFGQISYDGVNSSKYYVDILDNMFNSPLIITLSSFIIIFITALINIKGVSSGIEKSTKFMIPALFIILIVLVIRVLSLDGVEEGIKYYFSFNFNNITAENAYTAMGQAIFSLSVGSGTLYVYGTYVKKDVNIAQSALWVAILSLLVGMLSGTVIVPALFVFNYPLDSGASLAFITLPAIFSKMSYGVIFAILFFFIMLMAVISSTIALVEQMIPTIMEKMKISRDKAVIGSCGVIFMLSIPQGFSYNILADFKIFGKTIFDASDYLVSNVLLCGGIVLLSLYAGYILKDKIMITELNSEGRYDFPWVKIWMFAIKGPIPIIMIFVMAKGMGLF